VSVRNRGAFGLFSSDFKATSFWLEGIERCAAAPERLPTEADVVVIGSGYTGLVAAIQTARGGRATIILDAGDPGQGCSTRNGGHISSSVKPSLDALAKRFGLDRARDSRRRARIARLDRGVHPGRRYRLRFQAKRPVSCRAYAGDLQAAGAFGR
jgi:glycine/D-amino acid oxidase-like deaminating enzyme